MVNISADAEGIAAYGTTAGVMASELAAAGTGAAGAAPTVLGPIFGVIGGDFLAAYAAAHAGHVATIGQLSAVLGTMSGAAGVAAVSYAEADISNAAALRDAAGE